MKPVLSILSLLLCVSLHAQVELDTEEWDFGTVDADSGAVFHDFRITNVSDTDFCPGGIYTSCSCVKAHFEKYRLKPGETAEIEVSVNTRGMAEKAEYYVILTDPNDRRIKRIVLKLKRKS